MVLEQSLKTYPDTTLYLRLNKRYQWRAVHYSIMSELARCTPLPSCFDCWSFERREVSVIRRTSSHFPIYVATGLLLGLLLLLITRRRAHYHPRSINTSLLLPFCPRTEPYLCQYICQYIRHVCLSSGFPTIQFTGKEIVNIANTCSSTASVIIRSYQTQELYCTTGFEV